MRKRTLSPSEEVRLDVLMELFFKQFMTFSEYINEDKEAVPTVKYAKFVLYALGQRLQEFEKSVV